MRALRRSGLICVSILLPLVLTSCFVVVDVTEYGVFTRFGRVVRVAGTPGLYVKRPYPLERVIRLDKRLLTFKPPTAEFLSEDKKNLVLHTLVTWRIADPERFLATVGTRPLAEERLADVVLREVGAVVGSASASALISVDGHESQFDQLMRRIIGQAHALALADYGIDLGDVRLRQLSLPEQNRANVFARMQAERGRIATKYRSEGERESKKIVAEADREKTQITAEAYREAERTRAEGDAVATRIYADAFGKNPQLYEFRRTLQAYEKILDATTTLFLPADADILQVLEADRKPVRK